MICTLGSTNEVELQFEGAYRLIHFGIQLGVQDQKPRQEREKSRLIFTLERKSVFTSVLNLSIMDIGFHKPIHVLNHFNDFFFQLREFANFDFDIWRKKYMRWMNHKKSRVMDFFRRIDKDQDGKITRQEFIDGILSSSKF